MDTVWLLADAGDTDMSWFLWDLLISGCAILRNASLGQ